MKKVFLVGLVALVSLGSCKKEGCTSEIATNYDEKADEDDGSCEYDVEGYLLDGVWTFSSVECDVDSLESLESDYYQGATMDFTEDGWLFDEVIITLPSDDNATETYYWYLEDDQTVNIYGESHEILTLDLNTFESKKEDWYTGIEYTLSLIHI